MKIGFGILLNTQHTHEWVKTDSFHRDEMSSSSRDVATIEKQVFPHIKEAGTQ